MFLLISDPKTNTIAKHRAQGRKLNITAPSTYRMANTDFLYLEVLLSDNPSIPLTFLKLCLPIWRYLSPQYCENPTITK